MDVSQAEARIYRWRNEVIRRRVAQAKRILCKFYNIMGKIQLDINI